MERIATPIFETPVQWLRVGDLQLHLFLDEDGDGAERHHLGLTIDDFDAAYEAIRARTSGEWGAELVELPSGQVQLYFRDPAGNLIELNWPDAADDRPLALSRTPRARRARPADGRVGCRRSLYLDRSLA